MTVVPLVAALVVSGSTGRGRAASGRTARTAMFVFVVPLAPGAFAAGRTGLLSALPATKWWWRRSAP